MESGSKALRAPDVVKSIRVVVFPLTLQSHKFDPVIAHVHIDPVLTTQMDERIACLLSPALQSQPRDRPPAPPVETVDEHAKEAASLPKAA